MPSPIVSYELRVMDRMLQRPTVNVFRLATRNWQPATHEAAFTLWPV